MVDKNVYNRIFEMRIILNAIKVNGCLVIFCVLVLRRLTICDCSILDTVRRNNYRILKLILKLHSSSKRRDLDVALLHAVKAGYKECAKVSSIML
jgi:hypothetical protein